jgi:hypothetical protein
MRTFKWHSINLIPHASLCSTYDDLEDGSKSYGRSLQISVLGNVFCFDWKDSKPRRARFSHSITGMGPCYSRERKTWYWVGEDIYDFKE